MNHHPTEVAEDIRALAEAAAQLSLHRMARFMKDAGLRFGQYGVLSMLAMHGANTVGSIAKLLSVSNPAASQMLDRLYQMGIIERFEDDSDRRQRRYELTDQGHALLKMAAEYRLGWTTEFQAALTPEELKAAGPHVRLLRQKMDEFFEKEHTYHA